MLSTIATIIAIMLGICGSVLSIIAVRRSKKTEFFQRRDLLYQKISELNAKNAEAHMISSRFKMVAVRNAGLGLLDEQAERNKALIVSIEETRNTIERARQNWHKNIELLHSVCSSLTPKDAPYVETYIGFIQAALDDLKNYIEGSLAQVYILESSNSIIDEKLKKIDQEFDEKRRQINLDFERALREMEKPLD